MYIPFNKRRLLQTFHVFFQHLLRHDVSLTNNPKRGDAPKSEMVDAVELQRIRRCFCFFFALEVMTIFFRGCIVGNFFGWNMLVISGVVFDRFFQEISKQEKGSNKYAETPLVVLVMMGRQTFGDLVILIWPAHEKIIKCGEAHVQKKARRHSESKRGLDFIHFVQV